MKKIFLATFTLILLGSSLPCLGQTSGTITILGAGGSSCAKYLADAASSPAFQSVYLNWAMGYFTAINVSNAVKAGTKTINSSNGVDQALKTFCQANPNKNFSDAVLAFALVSLK